MANPDTTGGGNALGALAKLVARELEMQRAMAAVKPRALPPSGIQTFCNGGIAEAELLEAWLARGDGENGKIESNG